MAEEKDARLSFFPPKHPEHVKSNWQRFRRRKMVFTLCALQKGQCLRITCLNIARNYDI